MLPLMISCTRLIDINEALQMLKNNDDSALKSQTGCYFSAKQSILSAIIL